MTMESTGFAETLVASAGARRNPRIPRANLMDGGLTVHLLRDEMWRTAPRHSKAAAGGRHIFTRSIERRELQHAIEVGDNRATRRRASVAPRDWERHSAGRLCSRGNEQNRQRTVARYRRPPR